MVDVELEQRVVRAVDQDRDRLLEIDAGELRDEHTLSARSLLD